MKRQKLSVPFYELQNHFSTLWSPRAFTAGFIAGQCEKVYIGTCRAVMFRMARDRYDEWQRKVVSVVAEKYGLIVGVLWRTEVADAGVEMWVFRTTADYDEWRKDMSNPVVRGRLCGIPVVRGRLCGIPEEEIDPDFDNVECDERSQ